MRKSVPRSLRPKEDPVKVRAAAQIWRDNNREHIRQRQRIWRANNKDKCRQWRIDNIDACRESAKKSRRKTDAEFRRRFADVKSSEGCLFCGESHSACLDFHHKDRSQKIDDVAALIRDRVALSRILSEIEKCVVLCSNCHRKLHARKRHVVFKTWGWEDWIVNNEERNYCGKILGVKRGKKCSFHYHKIKTETFLVQTGKILMRSSDGDDLGAAQSDILVPGDVFDIPIGLRHQFEGIEKSTICEFSTFHMDSDSYRIVKGD
jgi:mannose-6-phosphate isomerase-like protein (cupin superfamily)